MSEQPRDESRPELDKRQPPPDAAAPDRPNVPAKPGEVISKKLTPEEQMALYENDLKENDWGHQPC